MIPLSRPDYLEPAQLNQLFAYLEASGREDLYLACDLMAHSGLRLSEVHSLGPHELDLENCEVYLRYTKLDKPRLVPLLGSTTERLRAYVKYDYEAVHDRNRSFARSAASCRASLEAEALRKWPGDPLNNIKIKNGRGRPVSRRIGAIRDAFVHRELMLYLRLLPSPLFASRYKGLQMAVNRLPGRVGLPLQMSPHTLRHTFGRTWLRNGGDLVRLSQVLGHSSISVTADVYGRFNTAAVRDEHRRVMGPGGDPR